MQYPSSIYINTSVPTTGIFYKEYVERMKDMKNRMFYLETNTTNPYYNLAFEEYVLQNCTEGEYLILWQNDKTIVVGQNQNTEEEINRPFVEENGIHVVRRATGGGAVYHDLGNLNYSFITDAGNVEELTMERFMVPVVEALQELGLDARTSGRNDILVEGHKVSGTAQRLWRNRILHHGTLLFDADVEMVSQALQVDPEKFRSKSAKSVRSRVGNIRDFLKEDMDLHSFWDYLKKALAQNGVEEISLPKEALEEIKETQEEKYETWDWNFGKSPAFAISNRRYFPGGCVEVMMSVEKGIIQDIVFLGDFLSRRTLTPIYVALKGQLFDRKTIEENLKGFFLPEFFGNITEAEILSVMFE